MPTSLSLAEHLTVLKTASTRLLELADKAGPQAPVPTCPGWVARSVVCTTARSTRSWSGPMTLLAGGCSTWGPTLTVPPGDLDEKGGAVTLTGSAAAIYLGLWNRGDELTCLGDPEFLARWRAVQQVFWVD